MILYLRHFSPFRPAVKNHHAYPHGLLEHSVEVTKIALDTVKSYELSEEAMQLVIIAGLFHDIGKTAHAVYTNDIRYCPIQHELTTFSLVGEPLSEIYDYNSAWYDTLMACWAPRDMIKRTECVIAKAVRNADQMSAAKNVEDTLFSRHPRNWHFAMDNGRKYLKMLE